VQEICKDIKQLDYAKRHLQTTITALKRLHMLITAVDQLSVMAAGKQYRESAHLLEATSQLLSHFEPYAAVARLSSLTGCSQREERRLLVPQSTGPHRKRGFILLFECHGGRGVAGSPRSTRRHRPSQCTTSAHALQLHNE